jgi:cbb3-type cytochrome oxidase cytochrome c subunit
MKYGPLIFLSAFFAMAGSWFAFVLMPRVQVGFLQQTNTVPAGVAYPLGRPGLAREGLDVYRANGCAVCHTKQIGQTATVCDVMLENAGTNQDLLLKALRQARPDLSEAQAQELLGQLPQTVLQGLARERADEAAKALSVAGSKATVWIVPVGPDITRGWGKRRTVAEDFLYDYPVMLGSERVGPDLANVGVRQPDPNWHLRHLYAPHIEVKGSTMPPFRFLFEKRRIERAPSPDALVLPPELAPPAGYEIVPKTEAKALVAYLTSLQADVPLFVAPLSVAAPPETNAPAGNTNSTNSTVTNSPGGNTNSTSPPATNAPAK